MPFLLGQALAITASPYTIIFLIPSVAITVLSWMIKKRNCSVVKARKRKKGTNIQKCQTQFLREVLKATVKKHKI